MSITPNDASRFFSSYKRAKSRADQWSAILEACFYFAVPFRNRFFKHAEAQGDLKNRRLYESIGVEATNTFVSSLHATMTPPQTMWGFLEPDYDGRPDEEIDSGMRSANQKALDVYNRQLFNIIHSSNFDVTVGESYYDVSIGTACLVPSLNARKDGLLYTSIPIDQLAIEESIDGMINNWFRTWSDVKISEIQTRWHTAVLTKDLTELMENNPNAIVKQLIEGVIYNPLSDEPYTYALYVQGSDTSLFSQDMEHNPGIVWRFQKTNNEWWGRGPVMSALPAMMRANEMARIEFASANLNTFRPYMAFSDGVFNPYTFKLEPMTVIPIASVSRDQSLPLIPLPDSSNPVFAQMTIADLRNQVNNLMYADPLGPIEGPARTATEQSIRQQNLADKIGPIFTRLQQEFLWPVYRNSMDLAHTSGLLAKPTLEDGAKIKFRYKSPLAQSKGQQDMAILTQYVQLMQGIFGPEVAQLMIDPERTPWMLAEKIQLDTGFLLTAEQMKQAAEAVAAQQAQQQAQANEAAEQTGEMPEQVPAMGDAQQ